MNLYLFEFEFIVGEYSAIIKKTVRARTIENAEKRAHTYLKTFYGPRNCNETDGAYYFYLNGAVGTKFLSLRPVESYKELEKRLSI